VKGAVFTVAVRFEDAAQQDLTWYATCDRCGQELTATVPPLTVIKVPNLTAMMAKEPERVRAIKAVMDRMVQDARSIGTPIIVDSHYEVNELGAGVLSEVLREHAAKCAVAVEG
jgi:hypothetical protein